MVHQQRPHTNERSPYVRPSCARPARPECPSPPQSRRILAEAASGALALGGGRGSGRARRRPGRSRRCGPAPRGQQPRHQHQDRLRTGLRSLHRVVYHGELAEAAPPPSDRYLYPRRWWRTTTRPATPCPTWTVAWPPSAGSTRPKNGYDNACRHACIPELTCHGRQDEKCLRSRWFEYCALLSPPRCLSATPSRPGLDQGCLRCDDGESGRLRADNRNRAGRSRFGGDRSALTNSKRLPPRPPKSCRRTSEGYGGLA